MLVPFVYHAKISPIFVINQMEHHVACSSSYAIRDTESEFMYVFQRENKRS
jgi:hypothetical protein